MFISKENRTMINKELKRQRTRISKLEDQAQCSHLNSVFIRERGFDGELIGFYTKRCLDCGLDIRMASEEALPQIKQYHEDKLAEIITIIEKDNDK